MRIPSSKLESFVSELVSACLVSREKRLNQYLAFKNIFLLGAENPDDAAIYNKTYAYIDDLESLLYSPVSLRLHVGEYDTPNQLDLAKFRVATSHLSSQVRSSSLDTMISDAVQWSLVKGKSFVKLLWDSHGMRPLFIQPEFMGVLQENRSRLDRDMEAFVHSTYITPYQFQRLIWNHPNRAELERKAKRHIRPAKDGSPDDGNAMKQIIIGGLYPLQPAGGPPSSTRGIVEWMQGITPELDPTVMQSLLRLDELWVWNDEQDDWSTFQIIGNDMLILGGDYITNGLAFNPTSGTKHPDLVGHHPFVEFCPNKIDGYFWGRSEIINVVFLQLAINSRINGINGMLRRQEDPPKKFRGVAGVNQNVLAKLRKPGGYWNDSNANANVEDMAPTISGDLWESLHEYERMFDEMGGLPPIAKGRGEAGVRSQGHAETLVRMFSPRFKDRALLVERDVEACGGLVLDLCRAHVDHRLTAWVSKEEAGLEENPKPNPFIKPPAPGQVPVEFIYANLPDDVKVTVDSHSSSPAFAADARALVFDLFKVGAMDAVDLVEHLDAPDQEALIAGIVRRKTEEAMFLQQHPELAGKMGGKKR